MVVVAHNLAAMFTDRQLNTTSDNKTKSTEKLASGYRINRAADDAAGLQISEKLREQIRGLDRGEQNTKDGVSFIQVADGAMGEIQSMIHRIRELAVQASNDTNTESDRNALQQEISQIKKEINSISLDTDFNTQPVFDNSQVMVQMDGAPNSLNVYNASYNAATGDVTYGGFIIQGERIPWDQVSPGMVTVDANGNQVFTGGDYTYSAGGKTFHITSKAGDTVPKIEVEQEIDIKADISGLEIDGQRFLWSELKNEDGVNLNGNNIAAGTWTLNYMGSDLSFFIGKDITTLSEFADAIGSVQNGKVNYVLNSKYVGPVNEKAVNAGVNISNMKMSNTLAKSLASQNGVKVTVRAGNGQNGTYNGIWLEDSNGNEISGSLKTWDALGIHSWTQGSDISSSNTYKYEDTDGVNDTLLSFDFTLSDVTSVDSVIDGLDGMTLSGTNIKTNYETVGAVKTDTNIVSATVDCRNNKITFSDENALGRDFDTKTIPEFRKENCTYNAVDNKGELAFKDAAGQNDAIHYNADLSSAEDKLSKSMSTYVDYVLQKKKNALLAGSDPDQANLDSPDLSQLVGAGNITTSGYFDGSLTIDSSQMDMTDGSGYFRPGQTGKTYPSAYIDFQNLGNGFTLADLAGSGFNSTCKTCNNHYTIMFVNGISGASSTPEGYQYSFDAQGSQDYLLQIDVDSLQAAGVTTGADLASALVNITSKCYDFHYTQYAADGSKFYSYDNRESTGPAKDATFDTNPYVAIDTGVVNIRYKSDDNTKSIDAQYNYNYKDIVSSIHVKMVPDAAGDYVKLPNGGYAKYSPTTSGNLPRYRMETVFDKKDGTPAADKDEMVNDYAKGAAQKMVEHTNVKLNVKDYTYVDVQGNENQNTAVNAQFDGSLQEKDQDDNVLHIQVSGTPWDCVKLPRIRLNNMKMRLFKADVSTYEKAQNTIGYADYALDYISEKRSLYGAYQNRLEHVIANNTNTNENLTSAESRLRDTDMAEEMVNYSKHSILEQAGQSLLAQANQRFQDVTQLLQL